ncbi:MAG: DUF4139 domain-containing protein [Bacteroidia bacterium]|nr:DUF4139 domain-containing protein [Bacteroidia bacterium]
MKRIWLLTLFLSALLILRAETPETPVSAPVQEVEIYRNGAQLVHRAPVKVQKGDNLIVFTGLSPYLQAGSITVKGTGSGIIQSVKDRVNYLNRSAKPPRMVLLEDSLRVLEQELAALTDDRFVLESEQALILKTNQLSGADQGATAQALADMANLYRQRLDEVRRKLRGIAQQERVKRERMAAYRQEVDQISARRNQPTQEVVVALQAAQAGTLDLELRYLVGNAAWNPYYDIRVDKTDEPLRFFLKAQVVNNTGVDWSRVSIRLSTASNSGNNSSPALSPWYVQVYEPRYDRIVLAERYNAKPAPAMAPSADSRATGLANTMELDDVEETRSAVDFTTTEEGELGLEFIIALPYDIPADGQEHQVDIRQLEVPGAYKHFAVPKLDRDAFLVAYISQDLLRGKANVYFEGTFVGETYVNTDNPNDSMKISLGRDPKVQIQREQSKEFTATKVIGGTARKTYGYEITLKNNKTAPVSIVVEDQIPVSQNKEIEVQLLEASGGAHDAATGKVIWNLDLKPGETRKLSLQFEVKYPKDKPVSGL